MGCPARLPDGKKSVLSLLAGLVRDAAAGLAGALAGGLAFAAAAVLEALHHVAGLESLNVLHTTVTPLHNFDCSYCTRIPDPCQAAARASTRGLWKTFPPKPAAVGFPPGFPQFQQKKPVSYPPFPPGFPQFQRG